MCVTTPGKARPGRSSPPIQAGCMSFKKFPIENRGRGSRPRVQRIPTLAKLDARLQRPEETKQAAIACVIWWLDETKIDCCKSSPNIIWGRQNQRWGPAPLHADTHTREIATRSDGWKAAGELCSLNTSRLYHRVKVSMWLPGSSTPSCQQMV